jgi:hypothetical protein
LVPPPDIDPQQRRRPMPSRSAALRDLAAENLTTEGWITEGELPRHASMDR